MTRSRVPSPQRRYITRARYLQSQRLFLRELNDARTRWNVLHPDFIVTGDGIAPIADPNQEQFDMPRGLAAAELAVIGRSSRDEPRAESDELVWKAGDDWRTLLWQLCLRWWPPEYYENWEHAYGHPALKFVAACLIWSPQSVMPEEWIRPYRLRPLPIHYDPNHPNLPATAVYWRARYSALKDVLFKFCEDAEKDDQLRGHVPLVVLKELITRLDAAVTEIADERYPEIVSMLWRGDYYVPLLPGLTSTDWQELEVLAVNRAAGMFETPNFRNRNDRPLREHAIHLAEAQTMSVRSVAALLGISPSTVSRWLKRQ